MGSGTHQFQKDKTETYQLTHSSVENQQEIGEQQLGIHQFKFLTEPLSMMRSLKKLSIMTMLDQSAMHYIDLCLQRSEIE